MGEENVVYIHDGILFSIKIDITLFLTLIFFIIKEFQSKQHAESPGSQHSHSVIINPGPILVHLFLSVLEANYWCHMTSYTNMSYVWLKGKDNFM